MTEIKEIEPRASITLYMLMQMNTSGYMITLPPTVGAHKVIGGTYWENKDEALHEQMMQAIKGQQFKLFELKWDLTTIFKGAQ